MAEGAKKPRIRKTAPTIRERAEAAHSEAEKKAEPSRFSSARSKAKLPKVKTPKLFGPVFGLLGKILSPLAPRYFVNAWRELKQVTWPSRRETWRLTGAVFVFATVFGTVVYLVDKGLDEIFKKVVLK